ncbi:MAG: MarR family winged helix-turn-helix transcriptional regulator [Tagaea sp.]
MRLTTPKTRKPPESADMAGVLGGTEIRVAYKMGYVLNFYREPAFRRIETEYGITRPEIVTLIFLVCRDGATARDICRFSGHLKANISRGIIALETKGLLRREKGKGDARLQRLHITEDGRALYKRYMPALKSRERAMLACLTKAERTAFEGLLDKLAAHVPNWGD